MRRYLYAVLCSIVLLAGSISAAHIVKSGNITSSETWGSTDTVRVTSNITVSNNATLTIEPGIVIRGFNSSQSDAAAWNININGTGAIYAKGTAADTIDFRTVRVEFQNLTRDDANLLEYCKFASGWGHALVEFRNTSTPTTENVLSHVTIRSCSFVSSGYCQVYITSGASPTFEDCYFTGTNTAIFSHGSDTLTVKGCRFNDAGCAIVSGAMGSAFYEPMVCNVDHCTFDDINNTRSVASYLTPCQGMAICSLNEPGELNVTNCIFNDIAGSGIRDWNIEDTEFDENWTVTNDYNMFYQIGADPCRLMDMGSNSSEANPLLGDGPEYALGASSPARNAASDGSHIGAWQVSAIADHMSGPMSGHDLGAIANPFHGTASFSFPSYDGAQLTIYDGQGQVVNRVVVKNGRAGWDGTALNGKTVAPGTYYYNLNADNYSTLQTLIKAD